MPMAAAFCSIHRFVESSAHPSPRNPLQTRLGSASDADIWDRALADGYVLVTKDENFLSLSVSLRARPPVC